MYVVRVSSGQPRLSNQGLTLSSTSTNRDPLSTLEDVSTALRARRNGQMDLLLKDVKEALLADLLPRFRPFDDGARRLADRAWRRHRFWLFLSVRVRALLTTI